MTLQKTKTKQVGEFLRPRRLPGFEEHALLDEMVLYLAEGDLAISLNQTARLIWEQCDGRLTVAEISRALEKRFNLPPAALLSDVRLTVQEFYELGLLALD